MTNISLKKIESGEMMIVKPKKKNYKIIFLEALLKRLPANHPKRAQIESDLSIALVGHRGEEAIDYHLSYLPTEKYWILHDLRLRDPTHRYFQLDTLLISEKLIIILEIKNYSGELIFQKDPHQLIRIINNKKESFQDPVVQVKRQIIQFKSWLEQHRFQPIPILHLIVISNSNSIVTISPDYDEARKAVILGDSLLFKIQNIESKFQRTIYERKEIKRLTKLLLKSNEPLKSITLANYQLKIDELKMGIICERCGHAPMTRKFKYWYCRKCETISANAHLKIAEDLLIFF